MTDHDKERRLRWAKERLDCDPVTGEPGYQELIIPEDLVYAMEAEAEHWQAENKRLRAEVARLRARIEVTEEDVDEADIGDVLSTEDSPQIVAWMAVNGFEFVGHDSQDDRSPGIWRGDFLVRESSPMADERVINDLASAVGRPPLDVLDEIAAMEVPA